MFTRETKDKIYTISRDEMKDILNKLKKYPQELRESMFNIIVKNNENKN